ncbi:uncharacterized protein LOC126457569 [Schistocerca serialis cubense]|uniref:uncharacterized protein LOC126448372 n=1 Tax=Schistocerca serialis cubense TaxID=2023355 RepID=UPI00214F5056|nr:uncharacterized protein LOC126448372 [Schistocerca serialis cubense]XP_049949948.1 uncharacterized protein LOC126457569 [Schistocerca serialis cubense]XP_049949956.1 uncharacterized protein LOC126457569 [Schistocerca serialis cubense]
MCFKCKIVYHYNCAKVDSKQVIWKCDNCVKVGTIDSKEEIISVLLEELQRLKAENVTLSARSQQNKSESQDESTNCHQPKKIPKHLVSQQLYHLNTSNRFSALSDKIDETEKSTQVVGRDNVPKNSTKRPIESQPTNKILLLSDSHGRNCASLLNEFLKPKYYTSSVVKPNACLSGVVEGASDLTSDFNLDDAVIILAGINDIRKKNNFIPDLEKLTAALDHTKLLLCTVPYCYDKPEVNETVYRFNEYIMNLSSNFVNVKVIDVNLFLQRPDYTNHGLHLNKTGKLRLCRNIASSVSNPWKRCDVVKTLTTSSARKVRFCTGTVETNSCQDRQGTNVNTRNRCIAVSHPVTANDILIPYDEVPPKEPQGLENNSDAVSPRIKGNPRFSTRERRIPKRNSDFLWPAPTRPRQRHLVNKSPAAT